MTEYLRDHVNPEHHAIERKLFDNAFKQDGVLALKHGDIFVGMAMLVSLQTLLPNADNNTGYIGLVYVQPEFQGQGHSKTLINTLVTLAKSKAFSDVIAITKNLALKSTLSKASFKTTEAPAPLKNSIAQQNTLLNNGEKYETMGRAL